MRLVVTVLAGASLGHHLARLVLQLDLGPGHHPRDVAFLIQREHVPVHATVAERVVTGRVGHRVLTSGDRLVGLAPGTGRYRGERQCRCDRRLAAVGKRALLAGGLVVLDHSLDRRDGRRRQSVFERHILLGQLVDDWLQENVGGDCQPIADRRFPCRRAYLHEQSLVLKHLGRLFETDFGTHDRGIRDRREQLDLVAVGVVDLRAHRTAILLLGNNGQILGIALVVNLEVVHVATATVTVEAQIGMVDRGGPPGGPQWQRRGGFERVVLAAGKIELVGRDSRTERPQHGRPGIAFAQRPHVQRFSAAEQAGDRHGIGTDLGAVGYGVPILAVF